MTVIGMQSNVDQSEQLRRKMAELSIDGFSSMGTYTPEEQLAHLDEIERLLARRGQYSSDHSAAPDSQTHPES